MKISRRDFLKKYAAMAVVGMLRIANPAAAIEAEDDEQPSWIDVHTGEDICHMCELEPWSCANAMYWCPKDKARATGKPVEIDRWDYETRQHIVTGIVYP